ncbi:murein L,D-transpeptidase catalytic domain family protein [Photobacterium sp. ZSDE20]|uniref:Murein L,D-transpeptidase catalytic domain family protein n=1 Tax=Photobacterium pectinilyticum TaxID=2906793 RepID=A0ABT1N5B1_9GAMM|nr:murein L,D-transpeptidase catalytic domain family protein [Photobacterium sp. ZSDE20]MCQ1059307.1 murein L,D-transpeptidase catalytic domain family protein [Photobacterium sp. ZSDE20]MDD1824732.1 murein L,D-transpeptidase catalytic domain family protein [Photobacterium sp. ZSDE20]
MSRANKLGISPSSLTIIDYTLPSEKERLFIVDLERRQITHQSLVAHAKESGYRYPKTFSNVYGSHKSSVGMFRTGETYFGVNGYSLRIDGLEIGINDRARSRFIVVHGADYVSGEFMKNNGMLGRSEGCFAIPFEHLDKAVNSIKESGYIFVYYQ